jgi:hypothetical protein
MKQPPFCPNPDCELHRQELYKTCRFPTHRLKHAFGEVAGIPGEVSRSFWSDLDVGRGLSKFYASSRTLATKKPMLALVVAQEHISLALPPPINV